MNLNKIYPLFLLSGLLAVFVLFSGVGAQEIDKEKAIEIVQVQGGPGGCTDETSCSSFCETPDNFETCINWARDNGLVSSEEADKAHKVARVGREFSGPGGCRSQEECHAFCAELQNHDTCIDFAVSQGFMTQEEANRIKEFRREAERFREQIEREREQFEEEIEVDPEFDKDRALEIIDSQGGPGGCQTMEECEAFCEEPQNQETCFVFAERHDLFKNRGHAQRIKKLLSEGGPGGCRGEKECKDFCENPDNFERCIEFAQSQGFIKPEQVEKARRGIQALKEGGPGGCKRPQECEAFCSSPANQEACFEWAKRHGLMSEEELRRIEEFKRRGEELRREFEQRRQEFEKRGEEYRPPEGFQPPGFGGTPPPEAEHIRTCFEKGGYWTGSTCEFSVKGGICPKLPTVDSCPSGQRKAVAYSSPECGTYYTCVPGESSGQYPDCGKITCFVYEPVCGVDGKTYSCGEIDAKACGVQVAYRGECSSTHPTYSPSPIYSPAPTSKPYYEDPATRCATEGGSWNADAKTCVFEKGGTILQQFSAYILKSFREFFR